MKTNENQLHHQPAKKPGRIEALDITRGIAVLGMLFMNFKIVALFKGTMTSTGYSLLTAMEGRFGVLFIFLAGMGVSLMNRKALISHDNTLLKNNITRLIKRALFLFVIGMIFSLYWQAEIFHYYAFYILIALILIKVNKSILIALSTIPVYIFLVLTTLFQWELGWNFQTLEYINFYHPLPFLKNLFFNGMHPIFPWLSFFILGMAMGKSNLNNTNNRIISLCISLLVVIITEVISYTIISNTTNETVHYMFSTRAFPPFPLFVISSAAQSIFTIDLVILLCKIIPKNNHLNSLLKKTGTMVMTHYVLHLFLGLGLLLALRTIMTLTVFNVFIFTLIYFIFTLYSTHVWKKFFPHGPLESIMRKLAG